MELTIEELQQYNTKFLKEVVKICEEDNIPYIGMFGTLIGAVRHKGTIPWDADVDIAVPITQLNRFVQAMEEKLPNEYWVDYRKGNKHERLFPRIGLKKYETRYAHVDVYPIIGLSESIEDQKRLFSKIERVVRLSTIKRYRYKGKKELVAKIARAVSFPISEKKLISKYDQLCRKYSYDEAKIVGCSNAASGYKRTFQKKDIEDTMLTDYSDFKIRIPKNYDTVLKIIYNDYMTYPPKSEIDEAIKKTYFLDEV